MKAPLITGVPLAWQQHYWKRRMMMPQMKCDCGITNMGSEFDCRMFFLWKLTKKCCSIGAGLEVKPALLYASDFRVCIHYLPICGCKLKGKFYIPCLCSYEWSWYHSAVCLLMLLVPTNAAADALVASKPGCCNDCLIVWGSNPPCMEYFSLGQSFCCGSKVAPSNSPELWMIDHGGLGK